MENSSNISLPRSKCMKCHEESAILLSSCSLADEVTGLCDHQICQSCFSMENRSIGSSTSITFKCPCCHAPFIESMQSIEEAILIGEASTLRNYIASQLVSTNTMISKEALVSINEMNKSVLEKLETALQLTSTNFETLHFLFVTCTDGHRFVANHQEVHKFPSEFYRLKIFDYSYKLLDHPSISERGNESVKLTCCYQLAKIFHAYHNYPSALTYSRLAYELCLRSSEQASLSGYKDLFLKCRADFVKLPPLRFAVGDEVEFIFKVDGETFEWRRGKVLQLYYRDNSFPINFTSPYLIPHFANSDSTDQPPVYAWVKADLDCYVRKVGVRWIEDTRYQAMLDAKIEVLSRVHFSMEFKQEIYCILALDHEFVEMLQSVWQVELSESMLSLYRALVMDRQPLIRFDSGYHVSTTDEVIAGIRAFFDPAYLSSNAALSASDSNLQRVRTIVLALLRNTPPGFPNDIDCFDVQGHLLRSIRAFGIMQSQPSQSTIDLREPDVFTVPSHVSDAISKASTAQDIARIESTDLAKLNCLLVAWYGIHICLDNPDAGPACECVFVYFFIKYCFTQGFGVPKLALALFNRMNMQLSREFIRCANPTCEHNRLDRSGGRIKFKKCSRCKAVIYCSRECQTAHYPDHKTLCRETSTREGS